MITLFGNLESGNVHKVQLILGRANIEYRRVEVSQVAGHTRTPQFLALNPMGKVPAVKLEDGDVLTESGALLYWFGRRTELWPAVARERTEVLRWMFFEQYSHEPTLAVMRYLRRIAVPAPEQVARQRELEPRAQQALGVMEARLATSAWLAGRSCSLADLALYPYTKWADEAGIDLSPYSHIERWLARVEGQPRFVTLRTEGAAEVIPFDAYFG
jgi:glutathione S-transferase